jgi:nucleotide-binding universal stress UspA family protein
VTGIRLVIVGASGSPASLQALRYAEELARANDALLIPVLAWVPPGGDLADRRAPCGYLRRVWAEDADHRLRDTLSVVLGEIPAGHPPIRPLVERGEAGLVLVNTACCPDDLLVVGAGRRSALTLAVSGKVYHYCVAHAHCPVVTVPPPDFAPGAEARPADMDVLAPAPDPGPGPPGPGQVTSRASLIRQSPAGESRRQRPGGALTISFAPSAETLCDAWS